MNKTGPYVGFIFAFEEEFEPEEAKAWMRSWWQASVACSAVYAVAIHAGQHAMSKRSAYELRGLMTAWSALLAVFSVFGSIRVLPVIRHIYNNYGFLHLICDNKFYYFTVSGFWTYAFATSKLFELGDTVFIILRKQKLSFLHWYHHITVFIYCWFSYTFDSPSGLVFGGMNYVIHSLMYTYYTLRALRIRLPQVLSMVLTTLQIVQMFIGIIISVAIYQYKKQGESCSETYNNLCLAFVMYFSYLILFAHFFYQRYMRRGSSSKPASKLTTNGHSNSHSNGHSNGVKDTSNGVKLRANGVKVRNGSNGVPINNNGISNGHIKSN